jgi:uncharacterized protein (TIGR02996 family)
MARKPPQTTGELLLRAVFAHPEDDAPRLAYADWLDESGGEPERAAFIRVQCELHRLPADDPRRAVLERQAANLLRGRKLRWRAQLPKLGGVVWGDFSRGFVDSVEFKSTYQFWLHSTRIAESLPLHTVIIRPARAVPREMDGFGRKGALTRVSHLVLAAQEMNDDRLGKLLSSPYLGRLTRLNLSGNQIGDDGAKQLARCETLPAIKVIDLGTNLIGDDGAGALAESVLTSRLDLLVLTGNPLSAQAKEMLRAGFGNRVQV